jgi:hypothetical protein
MRKSRNWHAGAVLAVLVAAQALIGTVTTRDINRRQPDLVRGPRLFWKAWGGTNTLGSAAYWLLGRRRATETPPTPTRRISQTSPAQRTRPSHNT